MKESGGKGRKVGREGREGEKRGREEREEGGRKEKERQREREPGRKERGFLSLVRYNSTVLYRTHCYPNPCNPPTPSP